VQLGDKTRVRGPQDDDRTARMTVADALGAPKSVSRQFVEPTGHGLVALRPRPGRLAVF